MTLRSQLQEAEVRKLTGVRVKILALRAVVLRAHGDNTQALATLAHSLTLAEPSGYVRTFLDEGEPMLSLLSTLLAQDPSACATSVPAQYVQRLLTLSGTVPPDSSGPWGAALSDGTLAQRPHENGLQAHPSQLANGEPLSARELEVLHLIAAGLSNQEITERLVIAMSTLKTHINHLYAKLAVRSRTQAIVQARALKLL